MGKGRSYAIIIIAGILAFFLYGQAKARGMLPSFGGEEDRSGYGGEREERGGRGEERDRGCGLGGHCRAEHTSQAYQGGHYNTWALDNDHPPARHGERSGGWFGN